MKPKLTFEVITLSVLIGLSTACSKDFLDQQPSVSQKTEEALSTFEGLTNATIGAYSPLCSYYWYGAGIVVVGDLKGGNAKKGPLNTGRYQNEYLWSNNPNSTSWLWDDAYSVISRTNNVINTIDSGFNQSGVTKEQLDELKGECLFLRALSYWDLSRMYCQPYVSGTGNQGVPIVLTTSNGFPARRSIGEVYDQVLIDLNNSISMLLLVNPRGTDGAWATQWAAKALLSKVYLYMGNWQMAANLATDVIDNGGFTLFTAAKYTTWDKDGYWGSGGKGDEIIFQVDGSLGNSNNGTYECIAYLVSPEGYGDIATSMDLLDLYESGDVRADLFVNPPALPDGYWTLKYPGVQGTFPPFNFNTPVLRLSEMYLIRAEALLNGATIRGVTARDDYNSLRTNRGLDATETDPTLDDIYNERRRELCFEGDEYFDLARTHRSLIRVDFSGPINKDVPFVAGGTAVENYLWAMPIPQAECDANKNMVQNPGY